MSTVLKLLYTSQNSTGNIAFSGIGLYALLGAINVGLAGRSYDQLSYVLGENFQEDFDRKIYKNSIYSSKWLNIHKLSNLGAVSTSILFHFCDLYQSYDQMISFIFRVIKNKVDFSNPALFYSRKLNEWISSQIYTSTINIVDESMIGYNRLIFINTMFYNADWKTNFNTENTKLEVFFDDKGQSYLVEMMNQETNERIYDVHHYFYRIMFKPLLGESLYSAIILPREGIKVDFVLKILNINQFYNYFQQSSLKNVHLKLPKFKIISVNDFEKTLKIIGIADIFNPRLANFSRMTSQIIYIENLMQVSKMGAYELEDNRAVSTEAMEYDSYSSIHEFNVNRPFLFFVYYLRDNLVLHTAVVTHPPQV
ncbi:Glia-derived nexin [Thelohanellus kitauei]|uniref:Glia-derived nexin n=1 Tax=Thelohanellus kitauei TaxID=669202 RepID=A0A0C2J0M5_THEKT|nr:Glia-derived nexin [Thelohanellus kitauei]